jgi:probable rRNA maturation factor
MAILFQNQNTEFKLCHKQSIKLWIKSIIEAEKKKLGHLNFVFTNDETILKTNIQFLNHNTYTDIITFDYCANNLISGDIIISIERVLENAKKFNADFDTELKRVIIHGVLHLCGYKDKTAKDSQVMRKKENQALSLLTITNLY